MSSASPLSANDLDVVVAREWVRGQLFGGPTCARIDRFSVLRTLGSGAMGTVFAAHDPRLDRQIALKVLRHDEDARDTTVRSRRARLLREARAMARLAHPNVGTVHDVGVLEYDGGPPQVWIAMELVDGEGLRQWCTRAMPTVREILAAYVQFGRGLAAAHAAGLVHRDVKPDNAMREASGRVRVLDFGLARSIEEAVNTESGLDLDRLDTLDPSAFTRTGAIIGTPAYMAPEQFDGQVADAASDQYAYCVGLFEALVGTRPHAGTTAAEIATARRHGEIGPWGRARVPRAVRLAIHRGLCRTPNMRWPTMDALVGVLERSLVTRRTGSWFAAAATAGLAALALWTARRDEPCGGGARALEAAWAEDDRAAAIERIAEGNGPFAASVSERLAASTDRYAASWVGVHREACESHRDGASSSDHLDRSMACLSAAKHAFGEFGRALATTEPDELSAIALVPTSLADPRQCLVDDPHATGLAPSPEAARRREELAAAEVISWMGRTEAADARVSSIVADAREAGDAVALGRALLLAGNVQLSAHPRNKAVPLLREATTTALAAGDVRTAIEAWGTRAWAEATGGAPERATDGVELVLAMAAPMIGDPVVVGLHNHLGTVALARGQRADARASFRRAIDLAVGDDPKMAIARANAVQDLAIATDDEHERELLLEQAAQLWHGIAGPEHPRTLLARLIVAASSTDLDRATAELAPVCDDYERLHPSEQSDILECTRELAICHQLRGEDALAFAAIARAHAALGDARSPNLRGEFARMDGRLDDAIAILEPHVTALRARPSRPWFVDQELADAELTLGRAWRASDDARADAMLESAHARHAAVLRNQPIAIVRRRHALSARFVP